MNSRWLQTGVLARALCSAACGALLSFMFSGTALAQTTVYRSVDAHGNVTFADHPSPGSEKVPVAPVQTHDALPNASAIMRRGMEKYAPPPDAPYTDFAIVSPQNDASLRANTGAVSVGLRLEPELREADQVQIFLDGKLVVAPSRSTIVTIPDVDRGDHTLEGAVVDAAGREVARTKPVVVHVLRVHR